MPSFLQDIIKAEGLTRMGTKSKETTGKFVGKLKLFVNELHDLFTQPKSRFHTFFKLLSIPLHCCIRRNEIGREHPLHSDKEILVLEGINEAYTACHNNYPAYLVC